MGARRAPRPAMDGALSRQQPNSNRPSLLLGLLVAGLVAGRESARACIAACAGFIWRPKLLLEPGGDRKFPSSDRRVGQE